MWNSAWLWQEGERWKQKREPGAAAGVGSWRRAEARSRAPGVGPGCTAAGSFALPGAFPWYFTMTTGSSHVMRPLPEVPPMWWGHLALHQWGPTIRANCRSCGIPLSYIPVSPGRHTRRYVPGLMLHLSLQKHIYNSAWRSSMCTSGFTNYRRIA